MKKRIHSLTLAAAAILGLLVTACHYDGDTTVINNVKPEHKTFDVVIEELTKKEVTLAGQIPMTLGFREGNDDIPYIRLTTNIFKNVLERNIEVSSFDSTTNKVTFTNKDRNNTTAVLDLSKHTLSFENYDLFFQKSENVYMDPADSEKFDYIKIDGTPSNIAGCPITLDWSTQDIDILLWQDGDSLELAVPIQFLNDVFLSPMQTYVLYNGNGVYLSSSLPDEYWTDGDQSGTRSQALAKFCYNELCLNFDFNYGLKAIHGIDKFPDFDTYFKYVGIKDELMSTDALTFAKAVKDVCEFFFGDGHSNYETNSHYLEKDLKIEGTRISTQSEVYKENYIKYAAARGTPYTKEPSEIQKGKAFEKHGNTAIVRFDHFTLKPTNPPEQKDAKKAYEDDFGSLDDTNSLINNYVFYNNEASETAHDTIALIYHINNLIKEDPSIENVVLDLSLNGGGAVHSAAFVIAWMLGKCTLETTDPITGAKWSATYLADVNCDGTYDGNDETVDDKKDTIRDKNLFCLVAPCSFSCGNMVPAMLKASDRVTILGVPSSGGTGMVQQSSAADGTTFRMSSKWVMSVNKNGSNYDIDRGVEPHYYINVPANFYNAATIDTLVKKINSGSFTN